MSTTKTTRPRSTRPALAGADQTDHADLQRRLRQFRAQHQPYVATIIAAGVFSQNETWSGVLDALARVTTADSEKALNGLFDRLETASPESTRIAIRYEPTDPADQTESAEDVLTTHESAWGEAGFLLGLAVGMQLGPHAFDCGFVR
jgi:hypothetical protein